MINKNKMDSKTSLGLCLKHSDNLFIILSNDFVIKEINSIALKILEWKKKEVFNNPIANVFKKYSTQPFIGIVNPIKKAKISTYIVNKNREIKIHWNIIPIYNKDKKVDFIFIVGKPATNLTDKQVEYLQLENVVKYAPGFFYWKDKNSVYVWCNDEFASLAGLKSRAEVIGKTDFDLIWKEGAQQYVDIDKEIIRTGKAKLNHEEKIKISHNKTITAITNKVPLLDNRNNVIGILGITTDITKQKNTEEALSLAKIEAESANIMKTNFIQNMQHDIRTPCGSVWSTLNQLVEKDKIPDKELLIMLRDSSKQLFTICNDVIDFDRTEKGDVPILSKRLDVRQVIQNVIELNRIAAYEKKLTLSFSVDDKIPHAMKSDEHRLSRILINLMGNALKFTQKGSVSLTANLIDEHEKIYIIQFKLQDTGIGIPLDKQNTLYEKFNRLNPANRNTYKGSGLGLRIVKKYVDDLDGEINVESEINKGTTFFIDIPFDKALVETIYGKPPICPNLPNLEIEEKEDENKTTSILSKNAEHNVLIIEDHPLAGKMAKTLLEEILCNPTLTVNVQSSLEILKKVKFDLVVADMGLPDGTGIDVINSVKKDKNSLNYSTPFVAVTANADPITIIKSEEAGFLSVMAKPMTQEMLQGFLNEFVLGNESEPESSIVAQSPIVPPLTLKIPELKGHLFEVKQFPLFDLARGLDAVEGKKEDLKNRVKQLIALIPDQAVAIEQATTIQDWLTVKNMALKIKDNANYCGTTSLLYASYYLEHYCEGETSSALKKDLSKQLTSIMQETKESLNDWLSQKNRFSTSSLEIFSSVGKLGRDLPNTEQELFELEKHPLLDLAVGIKVTGSEDTVLETLQDLAKTVISESKAEIQQAYAAENWDQVEKLTHKAKGGAEYGTVRMKYACLYLERYRKAGHSKLLEELYQQLMKVFDETQRYLETWLKE